jgi:hypothetical protein
LGGSGLGVLGLRVGQRTLVAALMRLAANCLREPGTLEIIPDTFSGLQHVA